MTSNVFTRHFFQIFIESLSGFFFHFKELLSSSVLSFFFKKWPVTVLCKLSLLLLFGCISVDLQYNRRLADCTMKFEQLKVIHLRQIWWIHSPGHYGWTERVGLDMWSIVIMIVTPCTIQAYATCVLAKIRGELAGVMCRLYHVYCLHCYELWWHVMIYIVHILICLHFKYVASSF